MDFVESSISDCVFVVDEDAPGEKLFYDCGHLVHEGVFVERGVEVGVVVEEYVLHVFYVSYGAVFVYEILVEKSI